jgi:NADPH:quinone reductase-like Zn-dependent oxidoreductase
MSNLSGLELRSKITSGGLLELWLEEVGVPDPKDGEVLVRVEATPINPSDLGMLVGPADLSTLAAGGTPHRPIATAEVPKALLGSVAARLDQAMPSGNEGAGLVIAAGPDAQQWVGRRVAALAPGMYAQYRIARVAECLLLKPGTTSLAGAAAFVNPLTTLCMLETLRREGHTALVHTAAASNLGQMLVRLCQAEGVALVNIVRNISQVELLRGLGARHVLDSTSPTFSRDLTEAIGETQATLAFDAIGGGALAGTILTCMERVAARKLKQYSRYGSQTHKQVYTYGSLDFGPTELARNYGMAWGIGGWLMPWYLQKIGRQDSQRLYERVAAELTTTFASRYSAQVTLQEALAPQVIRAYSRRATGEKYLITPNPVEG